MKRGLLVLLFIPFVWASIDQLSPEAVNCYENGVVELVLSHDLDQLRINSIVGGVGLQSRPGQEYTPLAGDWYGDDYAPIAKSSRRDTIRFLSEEFSIVEPGNYTFTLSPKPIEVTRFYPDVTLIRFKAACPGYVHSCAFVNLTIDECYREGDLLHVVYQGLGATNYSKVDQDRDISFYLNGQLGAQPQGLKVDADRTEYKYLGNDTYEAYIETDESHILSVVATISGCNPQLYKIRDYQSCGVVISHEQNRTEPTVSDSPEPNASAPDVTGESVPEPTETRVGALFDFLLSLIPY
ncbi:MAG: hypothetical protein ACQESG_04130 [Nanobdellota archaeon]